jgi:bis(5'-nucleosyl)-tetraphosphatase (symmetrical)
MATYVIGDVHGCYRELNDLLALIQYQDGDVLWFVGDLVNRGPASLAVLRMVHALPNKVVVLGNHDIHLLALHYGARYFDVNEQLAPVLAADDADELCHWLQRCPLLHHDADLSVVMVHAGIWPLWDLATAKRMAKACASMLRSSTTSDWQQLYGNEPALWDEGLSSMARWRFIINSFTRMRYVAANGALELTTTGAPGTQGNGLWPWYAVPNAVAKKERIIFGHWASLNGCTDTIGVEATDTGCAWGRELTALRLQDNQRFSVPYMASQ